MEKDFESILGKTVRPRNPFRGIYIYNNVQELIEIAFNASKKASPPLTNVKTPFEKKKKIIIFRLELFSNELIKRLRDLIKKHPRLEELHPFYLAALDVYVSKDELKIALSKIFGATKLIEKFKDDYKRQLKRIKILGDDEESRKKAYRLLEMRKKEAYGRIISVVKSIKRELELVRDTTIKMKKLPDFDPRLPIVLVVGPPNTGKSSLVKAISNAKVEIASYPFTTKNITFGHLKIKLRDFDERLVQIADTPGLFDRPMEKRKNEEKIVIKALATIPDLVVFMFDVSNQTAVDAESQLNILKDVLKTFSKKERVIIGFNKMDIADERNLDILRSELERFGFKYDDVIKMSVVNNIGISEVIEQIKRKLFSK